MNDTTAPSTDRDRRAHAPLFVPLGLVILGLVLLPFECIYNDIVALTIIGIGGWSLFKRGREFYACLQRRRETLARHPEAKIPRCI